MGWPACPIEGHPSGTRALRIEQAEPDCRAMVFLRKALNLNPIAMAVILRTQSTVV